MTDHMPTILSINLAFVNSNVNDYSKKVSYKKNHSYTNIDKLKQQLSKVKWHELLDNIQCKWWLWQIYCKLNTLAVFKSFVMNNKAFGNLFRNSQKSFHISPGSSHSNSYRGYRSFFKLNNGICTYKKILDVNFFVKTIVELEEWSIASIIQVVRSREGVLCVSYRINYQKLCDLMRQITKELNWPTEWWMYSNKKCKTNRKKDSMSPWITKRLL